MLIKLTTDNLSNLSNPNLNILEMKDLIIDEFTVSSNRVSKVANLEGEFEKYKNIAKGKDEQISKLNYELPEKN